VKRREFITLLGGAAALWPLAARAQERMRRVAVLMFTTPDEPESQARITALAQGLQEAGWAVGRNMRIDVRWSGGDFARVRKDAEELSRSARTCWWAASARPRRPFRKLPARYPS
jgi:putative ABC transport system substrate-binding protein